MIRNSQLLIFFTFHLFFSQLAYAQDQIGDSAIAGSLTSQSNSVNRFIDGVVKDFFYKQELQDLESDSLKVLPSNEIETSTLDMSIPTDDRKLDIGVFLKGRGAKLRVLDKIYGTSEVIELFNNSRLDYGTINFLLIECFYRQGSLNGDYLASIRIYDNRQDEVVFDGWMSSTQSHLTNYDNYRYSLWLLRCSMSNQE
ncbi:MAG: DUF2155 domain-containing protein [Paracoccaceae bacterium]|nr:DUF2155 domain-containing protein [Paracoccaceae bacterium]